MKPKTKKQIMGKRSKASGQRFEVFVRKDLESKGRIVDKWTNNVDLDAGKLVKVKPKFIYNPKLKRMILIGNSGGLPDFIVCKHNNVFGLKLYEVIGVESKMNGILDKEEKEKCVWLLNNKIFSKILIAKRIKVGRKVEVEYKEFKESKT